MSGTALDHPITLEPAEAAVTARAGGSEVARSTRAVLLREKGHDPVLYVPREDVRMDLLARSETVTHCPYKGDATYFSLADGSASDVAWSYEDPFPGVGGIAGHLAFDPKATEISAASR